MRYICVCILNVTLTVPRSLGHHTGYSDLAKLSTLVIYSSFPLLVVVVIVVLLLPCPTSSTVGDLVGVNVKIGFYKVRHLPFGTV